MYIRLFKLFLKQSLITTMAYPFAFWSGTFLKLLRVAVSLAFIDALFNIAPTIAGWSQFEGVLMYATYYLLEFLTSATFFRNLSYTFPEQLQTGDFDHILTKPIPHAFYTSFRELDLLDLTNLLPAILIVIWSLNSLNILTFPVVILYLIFIIIAYLFLYGFTLFITSILFYTLEGEGITRLSHETTRIGRLPTNVYPKPIYFATLFVIPVALTGTLPTMAVTGKLEISLIILACIIAIIWLGIGLFTWNISLNHYESASS